MTNFFHLIFLNNSLKSWIACAITIVLAGLFARIISKALASLFIKFLTKSQHHKTYSDIFKKDIVKPLSRYFFWLVTVFCLEKLNYPTLLDFKIFKTDFSKVLSAVSTGWLTICFFQLAIGVTMFIAAMLKHTAEKKNDRSMLQMISLLADLARALLIAVCVLLVLKFSFNYSISSFVTSLGLVTAALALAAKESVENIICSFIIFLDKPFYVGDTISANGVDGTVEKIGLRSTLLRTNAKTLVNLSNKDVIGGKLENISSRTFRRKEQILELDLSASSEDLKKLVENIRKIIANKNAEGIVNATVYLRDTGVNSHKIYIEYYGLITQTLAEFRTLEQKINLEIIDLIKQMNLALAKTTGR